MAEKKTIKGLIKRAKYYLDKKSILLNLEEIESRRPMKPIQVSVNTFRNMGIQAAEDDLEAWNYFASELEKRKDPISIEFEGTKTEEDPI